MGEQNHDDYYVAGGLPRSFLWEKNNAKKHSTERNDLGERFHKQG